MPTSDFTQVPTAVSHKSWVRQLVLTLGSMLASGVSTGWVVSGGGSMGGTREEVKLGWGQHAGLRLTFCTCGEVGS